MQCFFGVMHWNAAWVTVRSILFSVDSLIRCETRTTALRAYSRRWEL